MKAQFVYEALDFERGMDPKSSMEIGMEGKLKSWLKSKYGIIPTTDEIALEYCVMGNNLELVKYLIDVKKTEVTNTATNIAFQNHVNDEIILWLVTKGDPKSMDYIKSQTKRIAGKNLEPGWAH
jgi:hypothetical protein